MELLEQLGRRYCCVCTGGAWSLQGIHCLQHKVKLKDFLAQTVGGRGEGKGQK